MKLLWSINWTACFSGYLCRCSRSSSFLFVNSTCEEVQSQQFEWQFSSVQFSSPVLVPQCTSPCFSESRKMQNVTWSLSQNDKNMTCILFSRWEILNLDEKKPLNVQRSLKKQIIMFSFRCWRLKVTCWCSAIRRWREELMFSSVLTALPLRLRPRLPVLLSALGAQIQFDENSRNE